MSTMPRPMVGEVRGGESNDIVFWFIDRDYEEGNCSASTPKPWR